MVLNINLPKEQEDILKQRAEERGMSVEEFALITLFNAANTVDDATFRANLAKSIAENDELLKRLA